MESHEITPARGRSPGYGLLLKLLLGRVGRRRDRSVAMSYLLDAAELPSENWTASREATLRSIWSPLRPSKNLRWVNAARNYRHEERYLFIEVALMESEADADRLIKGSRTRYYRKPGVKVVAERDVADYQLPTIATSQLYERETARGSVRYVNRTVTGRVGDVFLEVRAGGSGGGFNWDDTMAIATAQAEKIKGLQSVHSH